MFLPHPKILWLTVVLVFCAVVSFSAPLQGRLSLGYALTAGNTEEEKVNFDFKLKEQKKENFWLLYDGLANYGKSSNQVNIDKKKVGVIGEFIQDRNTSFYLQTGALKDRFAGYDMRLNFGAGFYKTLIERENCNFKAAAGLEVTRENYTDDSSRTQNWLKLGLNGSRKLGENIKAFSSIDFGAPNKNYDKRYETDIIMGLTFSVNTKIDLETKYVASYRKTPMVAGTVRNDSTFLTNLVYKM